MLSSAVPTLMLAFLVICTLSEDAKARVILVAWSPLDYRQATSGAKLILKIKAGVAQGDNLERQHQTDYQIGRGTTPNESFQKDKREIKRRSKIQGEITPTEVRKIQRPGELEFKGRVSKDLDTIREIENLAKLLVHKQQNDKTKLKNVISIEMRENQTPSSENLKHFLWKRSRPTGASMTERDRSRSNTAPSIPQNSSKLKEGLHSISKTFQRAKLKEAGSLPSVNAQSSVTKSLGLNTKKTNSGKEISSGGLTSGYTQKPAVSGHSPIYPERSYSAQRTNSHPLKQSQAKETIVPRPSQQTAPQNRPGSNDDESPLPSPMKTPEVNQIWDYINRHSKKWSEPSPTQQPQPAGRMPSDWFQVVKHQNSPPMNGQAGSSSMNAKLREKEKDVDRKMEEYIASRKHGWTTPEDMRPVLENSQSASRRPPSPPKTQARKTSPPRYSMKSPPSKSSKNSRQPENFRQLSNKEIDDKYGVLANRVRSSDRLGQINPK